MVDKKSGALIIVDGEEGRRERGRGGDKESMWTDVYNLPLHACLVNHSYQVNEKNRHCVF